MTRIDEVDDVEHERSEEQRKQKEGNSLGAGTQDLCQPSEQERIDHELTHLSFLSWCRHCIKGRE